MTFIHTINLITVGLLGAQAESNSHIEMKCQASLSSQRGRQASTFDASFKWLRASPDSGISLLVDKINFEEHSHSVPLVTFFGLPIMGREVAPYIDHEKVVSDSYHQYSPVLTPILIREGSKIAAVSEISSIFGRTLNGKWQTVLEDPSRHKVMGSWSFTHNMLLTFSHASETRKSCYFETKKGLPQLCRQIEMRDRFNQSNINQEKDRFIFVNEEAPQREVQTGFMRCGPTAQSVPKAEECWRQCSF